MHAVVVTAYKDFPTLERMVQRLDPSFFRIFIHIDARSAIDSKTMDRLTELGCTVIQKYRIRWGSVTHLFAILDLLKMAVAETDCDYVHLVTGQDYPIATVSDFKARCDGRIFMAYEPLAQAPDYVKSRYDRYNVFYFLQGGPPFSGSLHKYLDRVSLWAQDKFGVVRKRVAPFATLYKGIIWMSFPREAGRMILEDPAARAFLKSAKTTYLAEEIFFQSFFLNSSLASQVVNNDLRFTDWTFRNGSVPAYLDGTDADAALKSGALFARKVSSEVSQDFMGHIDEAVSPVAA